MSRWYVLETSNYPPYYGDPIWKVIDIIDLKDLNPPHLVDRYDFRGHSCRRRITTNKDSIKCK